MSYENQVERIDELNREIAKIRPVDKALLEQIKEYFRVGLTYSSNAIEGNTLTETETKVVLEAGPTVEAKPRRDHYEAAGHGEAFDFVHGLARRKAISEAAIRKIHRLFYYRID